MTNKLFYLKNINKEVNNKIKSLNKEVNNNHYEVNIDKPTLKYKYESNESYLKIYEFLKDTSSKFNTKNEFNRLIVIEGVVTINFDEFTEEITLTSTNTYLVSPNTSYNIKSSKKSTVIFISKNHNNNETSKKYDLESIYIKNNNNE